MLQWIKKYLPFSLNTYNFPFIHFRNKYYNKIKIAQNCSDYAAQNIIMELKYIWIGSS